jgi:DNA-binding CsgD family transcriptional regulator
MVGRLGV